MARGAFAGLWDCQSWHRSAREAASERTVPTHSGASPRPDVRASGLTCPTRRTCLSSQRQQVAPDSPPSPQPRWATRPGALASGMDADGDLEELARLRSVFAACDANRSGRLEREEFRVRPVLWPSIACLVSSLHSHCCPSVPRWSCVCTIIFLGFSRALSLLCSRVHVVFRWAAAFQIYGCTSDLEKELRGRALGKLLLLKPSTPQ